MKSRVLLISVRAVFAAILLVSSSASALQSGGESGPGEVPGVQPASARIVQCKIVPSGLVVPGNVIGVVRVLTAERRVTISWSFTESDVRKFSNQSFDLNYWPTAAVFHKGSLYVAGRPVLNSKTIIEKWSISYPALPLERGDYEVSIQKSIVYSNGSGVLQQGKTAVKVMSKMLGTTNQEGVLLIQFDDSDDVYTLDLDSSALTLVYGSSVIPSLKSNRIESLFAAEIPEGGFIYRFAVEVLTEEEPTPILFDMDMDGVIDSWGEMTDQDFLSTYPSDQWVNYYEHLHE